MGVILFGKKREQFCLCGVELLKVVAVKSALTVDHLLIVFGGVCYAAYAGNDLVHAFVTALFTGGADQLVVGNAALQVFVAEREKHVAIVSGVDHVGVAALEMAVAELATGVLGPHGVAPTKKAVKL